MSGYLNPFIFNSGGAGGSYRYFNFVVSDNHGSNILTILADLQIYAGATKYPTPGLTAVTGPAVAQGVNIYSTSYPAWRAFTGVTGGSGARFSGKTGSVSIDLGGQITPTFIKVNSLTSVSGTIFSIKSVTTQSPTKFKGRP